MLFSNYTVVELVISNDLVTVVEGETEVICVNVTNDEQLRERNVTLTFRVAVGSPFTGMKFVIRQILLKIGNFLIVAS